MSGTTVPLPSACPHCGMYHGGGCSRIKSIEYYECGRVKRIEYHDINPPPPPIYPTGWWPPVQWQAPDLTVTNGGIVSSPHTISVMAHS